MHHSNDPKRRAIALAHYVDDSGGDGRAKVAVMGGPVFAKKNFLSLSRQWIHALDFHKVKPPIHMKEFARPDGRLAYLTNDERHALFSDLVPIINQQKAHSLTVSVNNLKFQEFFPTEKFRGRFGASPLAFLWCMVLNHIIVKEHQDRMERMAYVLSDSPINVQMDDCYRFFRSYENRIGADFTGSFTFDCPKRVDALQAADMVAWANRKKWLEEPFEDGFEPLDDLTRTFESNGKPNIHFHFDAKEQRTQKLTVVLGEPIRKKGARVSLLGVIPPMKDLL